MKLTIRTNGEDASDHLIEFEVFAETSGFKGSTSFYDYSDAFDEFAQSLLKFPFELSKPIRFTREVAHTNEHVDGLMIKIKLHDSVGHINFNIHLVDAESNYANFSDNLVEVEMLHQLARMIKEANFAKPTFLVWEAGSLG